MSELISVIMPTYNREKYIAQALRSLLDQDYRPLEIIVVDDGSTDATRQIVESFASDRIRYVYQENSGVAAARNLGLSMASGDFLAWLDSDDYYLPGKLTAQMQYLADHPDAGLVFTQVEDFYNDHAERLAMDEDVCRKISFGGTHVYMASMLARRSVFDVAGNFIEDLRVYEDVEWLYRAHFHYKICMLHCLDTVFLRRRLHPKSTSYTSRNEESLKKITALTNTYIRESIRRKHR